MSWAQLLPSPSFTTSLASRLPSVYRVDPRRLGRPGLLLVSFLPCGFGFFGILLPLPFSLVLLAFLVAHGFTPFWRGLRIHNAFYSFLIGLAAEP